MDARIALLTAAGGAGLLVGAWWATGGITVVDTQVPWVALAIVADVVIACANAVWLVTGRQAVRGREEELLRRSQALADALDAAVPTLAATTVAWVVVPGSRRFHRADCLLVQRKAVRQLSPRDDGNEALAPCEMCRPRVRSIEAESA